MAIPERSTVFRTISQNIDYFLCLLFVNDQAVSAESEREH
jgi:hypothetical protein